MTWAELEAASDRLAGGYRGLGLQPGDRIASLLPNRIALAVHYLACFKAGLVVTPLNYRYTHREIDHALEVSGARALLAHVERDEDVMASRRAGGDGAGRDRLRRRRGARAAEGLGEAWRQGLDELLEAEPLSRVANDPASPAAIFFTSGSTGPAKGVTHTHGRCAG